MASQKVEKALALFQAANNCSQSVLTAFEPEHRLPAETCFAVASPFGAGVARRAEMCGAVSGALMVLGLRHGGGQGEVRVRKERAYAAAQRFLAQFEAAHGSLLCRKLLGHDMSTPEGHQAIQDLGLIQKVCVPLVRSTVELLEREANVPPGPEGK